MKISRSHSCRLRLLIGSASLLMLAGAALAESPGWQSAADEAETLIAKSRRIGGDEHAQAARELLKPWWDAPNIPHQIRLQKATLLQRDHHFDEALAELNEVLRQNPEMAEAWLMKSTILTVSGRYEEARLAAVPLFALASPLLALTAGTAPTSCNGNLAESYGILKAAVDEHSNEATSVRAWALTALAEMAVRMGETEAAGEHFRLALFLDPFSPYLLKEYASHLLDAGGEEVAAELIEPHREHFPVVWMQIRKAMGAEQQEMDKLMAAYEANLAGNHGHSHGHRHGHSHGSRHSHSHGHSHGRDEAVYYLEIKGDAREAVHQAVGNWKFQREAADLLILLQASIAAKDETNIAKVRQWVKERQFEDHRIASLLAAADR